MWGGWVGVGFGLTLPYSLDWLVQKRLAFLLACAVAGPLSYSAGVRLEGMAFNWTALPVIAGLWAGIGLLVLSLRHRTNGRVVCEY